MTATRKLISATASFSTISVSSSRSLPESFDSYFFDELLEELDELFDDEPLEVLPEDEPFAEVDFLAEEELPDFPPEVLPDFVLFFVVLFFCATFHLFISRLPREPCAFLFYCPHISLICGQQTRQSPRTFRIALGVL